MDGLENTTSYGGINPRRVHFNAGTSRHGSGASFAAELRAWWSTQKRFGRQADIEAELRIRPGTFGQWTAGKAFPGDPLCDRLYLLTYLPCFSPEGRSAARLEHEQKRGLSRAAILKRVARQYVSDSERSQCMDNSDLAFTIRGDDWIICLECGQLLKAIRDKGAAAHLLAEHDGMPAEQYREGRYGKNRSLICNALAAKLASEARKTGRLVPDHTRKYLRSPEKDRKMPPEFSRKLAARMSGTRNLDRDTEVLRLWLLESLAIEDVAGRVKLSQGRVHVILQRIFGIRVKKRIVFSRGEPVTDLWINALCERFGLRKPELGELLRLESGVVNWLQQLGAAKKNRALTPETAAPLVDGEGLFLEILADANASADDCADYLCAVVPNLTEKRDGASIAIGIARDPVILKRYCSEAQEGNAQARIALAFLPSVLAWLPTLDNEARSQPVSELVREHFLPLELKMSPSLLRRAIEHGGPAETKPATIRGIIVSAFHTKELEAKLRARGRKPKKGKPDHVKFGEMVEAQFPRFIAGMRTYKAGGSVELRKALYTDGEIDSIRDSRNYKTAAIRWACKRSAPEIRPKTGKNYLSMYLASKKQGPGERPEN